jgi:hypothetical protein
MSIGENGILERASDAADEWGKASQNELDALNQIENEMNKYTNGGNTPSPDIPEVEEHEVTSRRRFCTKCRSNRNSMVRFRK